MTQIKTERDPHTMREKEGGRERKGEGDGERMRGLPNVEEMFELGRGEEERMQERKKVG